MPNIKVVPEDRTCPICETVFQVGGRGRHRLSAVYCSLVCSAKARIRYPLVEELDPIDAAYLAGLFDGEGSIIQWDRKHGGRLALRVTITSTDFHVLEWLLDITGTGSIVQDRRHSVNPNHNACGHWQLNGQNAVSFLKQILPYLIIKQEHAKHAIATQEPPFPTDLYVSANQSGQVKRWRALREAKAAAGGSL